MMKHLLAALLIALPFAAIQAAPQQHTTQTQQTLSIIKPDAVKGNHIGEIISRFEKEGLKIAGLKMVRLTKPQAMQFYLEHKDRPFYNELVEFMTSGPVVVLILEGDNAILKNRELMGTTDPKKAAPGTIRRQFAASVQSNAVHGSDSEYAAAREIAFFFKPQEINLTH